MAFEGTGLQGRKRQCAGKEAAFSPVLRPHQCKVRCWVQSEEMARVRRRKCGLGYESKADHGQSNRYKTLYSTAVLFEIFRILLTLDFQMAGGPEKRCRCPVPTMAPCYALRRRVVRSCNYLEAICPNGVPRGFMVDQQYKSRSLAWVEKTNEGEVRSVHWRSLGIPLL